ncbi:hypothetical protein FQN54_005823 [Arachnomyces sp. PD_36]|nr:hypothetical protein FQN54_005823 [Arachnomyces sp. PD_36]
MPSTAGIFVAIYDDGGIYKHWTLFIDGPDASEKTILNIMGSSTNYRFEMRNSDARDSETVQEVIYLQDVKVSDIPAIKEAGKNAVIHNEFPGYNCQDYVIELLTELEEQGIVDGGDEEYIQRKEKVKSRQEGFA